MHVGVIIYKLCIEWVHFDFHLDDEESLQIKN